MLPLSYQIVPEGADEAAAKALAEAGGYPLMFASLLASRGIRTPGEAGYFLHGGEKDMYSPFDMLGMAAAAERIARAIDLGEKVTIYGDYDVDGITATSILLLFFRSVGLDAGYYLPDRLTEGYGLNEDAVRQLAAEGTRLMITVDTGITAVAECRLAAELGMSVVITDHHECLGELPPAEAVVDAKQPGETYPFRYLAGCGVALKLVQALSKRLGLLTDMGPYFELAAVGTVADIVPLLDENRIIVREGFKRMRPPSNIGLYALMKQAGYDFKRKLTAGFIGFTVAPRLNAGGRMGDAARGVRLFTTRDEEEAAELALLLDQENAERRKEEARILEEAAAAIEKTPDLKSSRIMVVAGDGWHHGVIGIVSSRIKDLYYRPNILLTIEDGIASGSARSIDGFNLFEALKTCDDLMIRYGGHEAAAGMKLKAEHVPELARRLNVYAETHMDAALLTRQIRPELMLAPEEISLELVRMIEMMEPFGQAMPEPVIAVRGVLSQIRRMGADGETVRFQISGNDRAVTGIAFRSGELADFFRPNTQILAVGALQINVYGGRETPQLLMRAVESGGEAVSDLIRAFDLRLVTKDFEAYSDAQPKLDKSVCAGTYRFLQKNAGHLYLRDFKSPEKLYPFLHAVCVFEELGLMDISVSGPYFRYRLISGKTAKLKDSCWFRRYFGD